MATALATLRCTTPKDHVWSSWTVTLRQIPHITAYVFTRSCFRCGQQQESGES